MLGEIIGLALLGGAGYVGWRLAKGGSTLKMNPSRGYRQSGPRVTHYGAVDPASPGLVPACDVGFKAWERGSLTPVTSMAEHVTCKHCLKYLESAT